MGITSLFSGLFGGAQPQPVQVPQYVQSSTDEKTPAQIAAEEDAKKKAALIALNAGGAPSTTVGGGNADVTRKILLGL